MDKIKKVKLTPAACGLDLGDGSERAEYVNQDYISKYSGKTSQKYWYYVYLLSKGQGMAGADQCGHVKIWRFIFSGIIRMMIIFHIVEVSMGTRRESRSSR